MSPATRTLLSAGGLYEATVRVHRPPTVDALAALFAEAHRSGKRFTLIGAGRSFGRHFLPPEGAEGLDTTGLGGSVAILERTDDGLWVRVPGNRTFEELWREVPGHLPRHAPTGDRVTIAGALAACGHNTSGFFARDIRAFRVMSPGGTILDCRAEAPGIGGELFRCVPGSFGALAVILDVELFLRKIGDNERAEVTVLARCPIDSHRALDRLDHLYETGQYPLGLGVFFFGAERTSVLLGDRSVTVEPGVRASSLPLIDDATRRNVVLQGLSNWAPAISHRLQPLLLREGRRFQTSPYGFTYYQRSYERAYDILAGPSWWARALRGVGVDPRLTVCHQSFAIPLARGREFIELYFQSMRKAPEAVARLELQDLLRLPACPWPMHGAHGMPGGSYLLSVSFSVRRGHRSYAHVSRLLGVVTRAAFERFGVRTLLLKQIHCDVDTLQRMHAPFRERLRRLRPQVDPACVLTSQLLEAIG